MTSPAPPAEPGPARSSTGINRTLAGLPLWLWGIIGASVAGAGYLLYRNYKNSKTASASGTGTSTTTSSACTDADGSPVDCNSILAVNSEGQAEYEQTQGELTGLSGQDAALLQSIQNLQGQSSSSATAPTAPAIPTVTGLQTTSVTASNVSLKWTAPPGVWFYVVTYSTGNQNGPVSVVGGTTWTSPKLLSNTQYTFNVQCSPESSGQQQLGPRASVTAKTT
jgi:hypothetical protein